MRAPTSDQLRDQIDSGQTGDKHAVSDPAAAPLGTDAEAGGSPPSRTERTMAQAEAPRRDHNTERPMIGPALLIGFIVLAAIVLSVMVLVLRA